ncbi:MAG: replication protein P [Gammaproteobacteria bacterium]|jgi:hypothetical protein|nr:replication protein P [Gammaproteobacteria bacterium]MDP6651550.1 replication protein P [Gammaproteobacteria bacterium]
MQKINPLLDQVSEEFKKGSNALPTEAGPNRQTERQPGPIEEPAAESAETPALDRVDAINQVFAEFEFAYHNQFHKAFADVESLAIAKKYWLSSLENYSPTQILRAAKTVICSLEYLPSIAIILRACEQGTDLFGLPSVRQAYLEACGAASPKREQHWSHEAVYFAGKSAGWYLLANEPEATALPVFQYHYESLCRRVVNGEQLSIELPPALTEKIERKLDKQEVRARIARMKQELGLK